MRLTKKSHFFFMVIKISVENMHMTRGLESRAIRLLSARARCAENQFGQAQFRNQISFILSRSAALSDSRFRLLLHLITGNSKYLCIILFIY